MEKSIIWDDLPKEIQDRMLDCQVEQGNKRSPDIFKSRLNSGRINGGFNWHGTKEDQEFWRDIIANGRIETFYEEYPKKTSLPVQWCIKVTNENKEILKEWRLSKVPFLVTGGYLLFEGNPYSSISSKTKGCYVTNLPKGTPEITFEQFKKYVLEYKNKKYSIEEIENNYSILIYLDSEEEHKRLKEITNKVCKYFGQYCYNLKGHSYSSKSSEKDPGSSYSSSSIILRIDDIIELNEEKEYFPDLSQHIGRYIQALTDGPDEGKLFKNYSMRVRKGDIGIIRTSYLIDFPNFKGYYCSKALSKELKDYFKLLPTDYNKSEINQKQLKTDESRNIQRIVEQDGFTVRSRGFRFEDTGKEIFNRSGFSQKQSKSCFQEARIN